MSVCHCECLVQCGCRERWLMSKWSWQMSDSEMLCKCQTPTSQFWGLDRHVWFTSGGTRHTGRGGTPTPARHMVRRHGVWLPPPPDDGIFDDDSDSDVTV